MTSSVPLRAYHHSSLGGYADSDTIAPSNSKGSAQSYEDDIDLYDPYVNAPSTQGKSWGHMSYEESATDGIHKPSLSYDTKDLGK